jgi:hypothetical protein
VRGMPVGRQLWHVSNDRWATTSLLMGGWETRSTPEAALGIEEDK